MHSGTLPPDIITRLRKRIYNFARAATINENIIDMAGKIYCFASYLVAIHIRALV